MKVRQMAANQYIIEGSTGGGTPYKVFQSYNTTIAVLIGGNKLHIDSQWKVSATTVKYLKKFINEETPFVANNSKTIETCLAAGPFKPSDLNNKEDFLL